MGDWRAIGGAYKKGNSGTSMENKIIIIKSIFLNSSK